MEDCRKIKNIICGTERREMLRFMVACLPPVDHLIKAMDYFFISSERLYIPKNV